MKTLAQAKVNLGLDIKGIRKDGYHELDMIMAPISLYNEIEIDHHTYDRIFCDKADLPENSTVHKALSLARETFGIQSRYDIKVFKHIPDQAGLAGSSADGAAIFKAVLELEGISVPEKRLLELGKQIGADVPFCLVNRMARVQGIGEKIRKLDTDWKLSCLLVKPQTGVSTPAAFKTWHRLSPLSLNMDAIEKSILLKDYDQLIQSMANALERPAFLLCPEILSLKEAMEARGLDRVMMTGSGSTLMGFSQDPMLLEKLQKQFANQGYFSKVVTIG